MPVHLSIQIYTLSFSDSPLMTKFGENGLQTWEIWQKVYFSNSCCSMFSFFSLNFSISKTLRGTGLKFCTQVGPNDPICSDLLNVVYL